MGNFTVHVELPRFIPKEEIMGKRVFDSEVVDLGVAEDWTYGSDGEIKMVVKKRDGNQISTAQIPFSHIERVGQFIVLKTKQDKYRIHLDSESPSREKREKKKGKHRIPDKAQESPIPSDLSSSAIRVEIPLEKEDLTLQRAKISRRLDKLDEILVDGQISEDTYIQLKSKYQKKLEKLSKSEDGKEKS